MIKVLLIVVITCLCNTEAGSKVLDFFSLYMMNKYPLPSCREAQGSQYILFVIKNADFVRSQYKTQTHMAALKIQNSSHTHF